MVSKEVMNEIKLYMAQDYEIKEETSTYVLMQKNTSSVGWHLLIALFLGWWLLFIPNIIYYLASFKKHKVMK